MAAGIHGLGAAARGPVTISIVIAVLTTASHVAQGALLAGFLANVMSAETFERLIVPLILLITVVLLRGGLLWASELVAQSSAQAIKRDLRRRLLDHLLQLGPGVTLRRQTGDLQMTIVGGVEALESYYSRYIPAIFGAIFGCGLVLAVLTLIDWPSALLLALFVIAFPVIDRLWMRWRMPEVSGVFAAMGAFGVYLLDSLQGILTLKAFGAEGRRRAVLVQRAADLRRESMATLTVTLMRTGLTGFITLAGIASVLCLNMWRVASGELPLLSLLMTLFLAREAFRPLDRLEKEFHTAWAASGALPPIRQLLAMRSPVAETAAPAALPLRMDVTFENVTFTYEGGERPALSSTSFMVEQHEFVALVGASGAGKSTVATLLLRFFDPDSGSIRIGGRDIRQLSLRDLRSLVSVVSQDTVLFHGTIADNLRLAKPEATDEELHRVARAAHIAEFIETLPQAYETPIGERGVSLSGGQRQRLAIARALLKDTPILLLDEATSNVDPASERAIQSAIDEIAGHRTVIVIAHRLSTVVRADRVLVFEAGEVVEQGAPADLERNDGAYARLIFAEGEAA